MNLKLTRLACTLALTGLLLPLPAQETDKTPAIKIDPTPVKSQAGIITSFAPIVEKVAPSVVQISTSKIMKPGARGQNKMFDDPFFRRFFGLPDGEEDQPAPQRRGGKRDGKEKKEPFGLGSGVIVSADGHILTNNHVIDGADDILVVLQGDKHEYKAKKVAADSGTDIAVLKLVSAPAHLKPITFGDSDKVRVGDLAIAIGNPFGLTQTVSMGIISSLGRNDLGITAYENFIQTDASINPGNSGGALVDIEGRLVGINQSIYSRTGTNAGIGFAVPANLAHTIMDSLLTKGRVVRGYLGVMPDNLSEDVARKLNVAISEGALISSVEPKSPAEKAGIVAGDVVTEINGHKIGGPSELRFTVSSLAPGTKVNVKYLRDGKEKKTDIVLAELPGEKNRPNQPEKPESIDPDVLDGVTVANIDEEARKKFGIAEGVKGVAVTGIENDSPCYAAGLRVGDVIHEIERKPVSSADDAVKMSEQLKKEKEVLLRVSTKGVSRFVVVKDDE